MEDNVKEKNQRLRVTLLGTGTSGGVPSLGCQCEVCRSQDPRDKRMRCVAMVESESGTRVLIDCGPDIRQQLMPLPFKPFDAILLTHIHYDHVGGIDDLLRYVCMAMPRLAVMCATSCHTVSATISIPVCQSWSFTP